MSDSSAPQPALTVYSVGADTAADCHLVLGELARQTAADRLEVIIAAPSFEGFDRSQTGAFANFVELEIPPAEALGQAMAASIRAASGKAVVYAEEHTYLSDDWAERLIEAHQAGRPVVGFSMTNANPGTLVSWAHYFGQFAEIVAPVESGPRDFLAGHHVSYDRELLLGYGELLAEAMEDETAMFLDLRKRGVPMWLEGRAMSNHVNVAKLGALLSLDYTGQRSFAATRARLGKWPWWRRLVFAGGAPLVPFLRIVRIWPHLRRVPEGRRRTVGVLAVLAVMCTAGAVGEAMGYLFGAGSAHVARREAELEREKLTGGESTWTKSREAPQAAE
ncbi:MAG: hypothetical protein AAF823_04590 [Planctomycetota bacterium]